MELVSNITELVRRENKPPHRFFSLSSYVTGSSYRKGRGWCCQNISIGCTLLHRGRRRGTVYCYSATYEGSETLSKGGYLCKAHPPHSSVTGARGRGEGGRGTPCFPRGPVTGDTKEYWRQVMRLPAQNAEIATMVWPGSGDGSGPPSYCVACSPAAPS